MFCLNCGTKLPDDANYCYKCGVAIGKTTISHEQIKWEYCEILWHVKPGTFSCQTHFVADAVGPNGSYVAARSPVYKGGDIYGPVSTVSTTSRQKDAARANEAHKKLVQILISDGWEPVSERGENWWQLRFKRRAK